MASEKLENILNLALEATDEERQKSEELDVGYDREENMWELIVKYHGDILPLADMAIGVELLIAGYAILTVPESMIDVLADIEEIEYIEKPKRLFFETLEGKQSSCILPVTIREPFLTGEGVILAVVDSGIDYRHRDFRNADGTTRIISLWDQTIEPDKSKGWKSPEGFLTGVEFTPQQINEALLAATAMEGYNIVPSRDITGHGTAVAGIAAGSGVSARREEGYIPPGAGTGVAPESGLLIVKLGTPRADSFPRTTELMRAMTYVVNKAIRLGRPVSVNVSFGNTYGSHDGSSLLERFMDNVSEIGRSSISVGSGNEGASMGHAAGNAFETTSVELAVGNYEGAFSVQLWKNYVDSYLLDITSPGGGTFRVNTETGRDGSGKIMRERMEQTELLIYIGEPTPYSAQQEIYIDFLPADNFVNTGIWTFTLTPVRVVTGNYSFYLPSQSVVGTDTHFYRPTPEVTLTIPSTSAKVITVGAYNSVFQAYADFSGRGYLYAQNEGLRMGIRQSKPDLVAPGVGIVTTMSENTYGVVTGTSFATPFVSGSAALMMEWGIVRGNDAYLYGEKVKAYLQRGARPLPGFFVYPNPEVGYGALCLEDSLLV